MSSALCLSLYFVFSLLSVLVRISASGIEARMGLEGMLDTLGGYQSPTVFFASVCFFLFFQNIKIQGNRPKKSSLRSPRFLLAYICCMTAILPAHFSGKNRAFPFWKPACVPWLPGYRNRLHHLCRVSCRYAVSKIYRVVFRKKRRGKWMRSQHGFIGASEKASEAFHSP